MANTVVESHFPSGLGTLTMKLYPDGSTSIANGAGGDTASEDCTVLGLYNFTVTESISGLHLATFETSGGAHVGTFWVELEDDTNTYKCKDQAYVEQIVDIYHADVDVVFNDGGATPDDEYTVNWYKNGVEVSSLSSPTIQVIKQNTAADLIASAAMSQVGATQTYKYTATSAERMTAGEAYMVVVGATINGAAREWPINKGRDYTT